MSYSVSIFRIDEQWKDLITLWQNNFAEGGSPPKWLYNNDILNSRLDWLYKDCPYGSVCTFLVKHDETNIVIGCGSFLPRIVYVNGHPVLAAMAMDFAVNKEHRVAGPALLIQRSIVSELSKRGCEFIFGYPNDHSLAIFKRIGYNIIGSTSFWIKPLRVEYKLFNYLRSKVLSKALGFVPDLILDYFDRKFVDTNYYGSVVRIADEPFNDLLTNMKQCYSIVPARSSSYINWRYLNCKTTDYRIFSLTHKPTQSLQGYVVYKVENNKISIVDIFCVDFDKVVYNLLAQFAICMRKQGYYSICVSYVGNEKFHIVLEKMRFFRRNMARNFAIYAIKEVPQKIKDIIFDKNNWFMFNGELDI